MKCLQALFLIFSISSSIYCLTSIESKRYKDSILEEGQKLISKNGKCRLHLEIDGNLKLTKNGGDGADDFKILWSSNTEYQGIGPYRLVIQNDGNLVLYDHINYPSFCSNTYLQGAKPYTATVQDDCKFVVYDSTHRAIWTTQ